MTIPRKGTRRITVDGIAYNWRIRRRATRKMKGGGHLWLAVDRASPDAVRSLLVSLEHGHARNTVGQAGVSVTPRVVAELVRYGCDQGWVPEMSGPPFTLAWRQAYQDRRAVDLDPAYATHFAPLDENAALRLAENSRRDKIAFKKSAQPASKYSYDHVELLVNDVPLFSLVKRAEESHVARETKERQGVGPAAGEYATNWGSLQLPNEVLLGINESDHGFVIGENDARRKKVALFGCACGIYECWFLLCRVWALPTAFVWSDFEQFHRPWIYDLGPFVFDREQYLEALGSQIR